ncbi:MAG: effector binding domain-containing protein [Lachnospiraceae bacterium]|nr:effector binding domain-containing protein [Lachnospiraceae bacterium]
MNQMTIGEVSSAFQISTRMLRYYEKIGLIESTRKEGYAYRVYDAMTVRKVQQIIILRKLQIPLKHIRCMMEGNREETIRILETRIQDMNENVHSVHAMKKALEKLLEMLREDTSDKDYMRFVQEDTIVELTEFLPLEKHHLKGAHKMSMAKEMVEKGNCVRIVLLPPCTVAAFQFEGDDPEEKVGETMNEFIRSTGLYEIKPDARLFGFNNPEPEPGNDHHGYEDWVTIPDDMDVPEPLVKKHFDGGLYAAYTINFPDFYEWSFLQEWVRNNEKYEEDYRDYLEEHLNWVYSSHMGWPENGIDGKIDLLLPIKPR